MTFTLFGCRITLPFLLLAAVTALLFCDRSGLFAAALVSAAVHEGAHLAALRAFGGNPRRIRLTPFGIDIVLRKPASRSYLHDAAVSLAGPFANLAEFAALSCAKNPALSSLSLTALALFLFNILPIAPLDGGQALEALLCIRLTPQKAEHIMALLSFAVLLPLAVFSFLVLFRSHGNFSLLLVCCYLMALLVLKKDSFSAG